jgi:hypothetical protein
MNPHLPDTTMNLLEKNDLPEDLFLSNTMQIDE